MINVGKHEHKHEINHEAECHDDCCASKHSHEHEHAQTHAHNHEHNHDHHEHTHNHEHSHSHHEHNHDHHEHNHDHHEHTHNHEHSHSHKDSCCSHDHHDHEHGGCCACESGLLEHIDVEEEESKRPYYIMGIGAILFVIGFYIAKFTNITSLGGYPISSNMLSLIPLLLVVIIAGHETIEHGIRSISHGEIKIEFLMTIATIGAFLLGDYSEGAGLMLLFFIGEWLEDFALDKSKKSIANIVKLSPDTGIVKKDGKEIEMAIEDIKIGDIVVIRPGDKIPIDGVIIEGSTSINQASITGESLAVSKTIGDEVYSSTINEEGYIEVRVNKSSENTIFAKIIELIKESEEKKAKVNLLIDRFAKYYTPIVVGLALIVGIIPPLILNQPINQWVYRALVLLVISCPCALIISTPVSIVSAITAGTKNGMVIKGGEYIEELANIKAISFDKTGTLTEGKLIINQVIPAEEEKEELMKIACSIEAKSKHPIAEAFKEYAVKEKTDIVSVENFKSIAGNGLIGEINGTCYKLGKKDFFDKDIIPTIDGDSDNADKTQVYVGTEDKILGIISLSDKIRDESISTIAKLNKDNIKTIMLTGDNEQTAKQVASEIGLSDYYANLLPEDKVNKVHELVENEKHVAMVGDGVNDTPSLARANVGIAMGMGGADVAVETADIILMRDDLSKIGYLTDLAKKTMGVIKQNITATLVIKASLAILGILGLVSLWGAIIIGDMGLTLIVVGNALRIARE